ncbi:MAG: hypothetical protein J7M21_05835 [Planctomycetes bacterium]|nr:hypothetical protein [Planctomycetota bacterium]
MNILTKICIVVLLILVLFASFTFINMATVPQNWYQQYKLKSTEAMLNAQAARFEKLHASRLSQELKAVKAKADSLAADLADARKSRVPDPTETMAAQLKAELQSANTRLAELQLNVDEMSKRNERLLAQLDDSRKTIDDLQKTNRQSVVAITELRSKLEREQRVVHALQRQLQDRDERIAELEKRVDQLLAGAVPGKQGPPVAAANIAGTITAVQGELASINVGAAQGVTKGLKLYIYRNANFVGYLRVDEVDEGEAAGTIIDKQLDPMPGDKVTNDLLK